MSTSLGTSLKPKTHISSLDGRRSVAVSSSLVLAPVAIFYGILFHSLTSIPNEDDYETILAFLNETVRIDGFRRKCIWLITSQHNEYKLIFEHAVAWIQLQFLGHVSIIALGVIGDLFVLFIAGILWAMFLPDENDMAKRLALFVPVAWILFQLQYAETLNFVTASLFNLPAIAFSFCAIYCLCRRDHFIAASACLVLAVSSSGNGLLMIPLGIVILLRDVRRLFVWLGVSCLCVGVYAFRYNLMSSQSPSRYGSSVIEAAQRINPLYFLALLGSAGSSPVRIGAYFLSLTLCAAFVYFGMRGWYRRNPTVAYCIAFVLLTAVGAAALRSDFGVGQSLQSRYAIYSALLLIFLWYAIVENLFHGWTRKQRRVVVSVAIAMSICFSVNMDFIGHRYLVDRNARLRTGLFAFQHEGAQTPVIPIPRSTSAGL